MAVTDADLQEVLAGLRSAPKAIAPKYFYNATGAALFDAITELDEYYVTRTEASIFREHRAAICAAIGTGVNLVEPGAGSCEKIRWLLPELAPGNYSPLDISAEHLARSAAKLAEEYPDLSITPQVCDHTQGLDIVDASGELVFFYPGSSIGNFEPLEAIAFLSSMRQLIEQKGGLLIGVDAKKATSVLDAAYNDSAGITAEFNLNVIDHLNERFAGSLVRNNFAHHAFYNEADGRIEMHLRCLEDHTAALAGESIDFAKDELIHTENSYKYHPAEFAGLAAQAGFAQHSLWQDSQGWFSLFYFVPE